MSDTPGTLELLARHLTLALKPFSEALADEGKFRQLMSTMGWDVTGIPPSYGAIGVSIDGASIELDAPGGDVMKLVQAVKGAFDSLQAIAVAPPGVNAAAYMAEIRARLFELLLTEHLNASLPAAFNALRMLGVIGFEPVPSTPGRPSFIRTTFQWAQLPKIISDPGGLPARVFGWGGAGFDIDAAIDCLAEYFASLGLPVRLARPAIEIRAAYAGVPVDELPFAVRSLIVPFFQIEVAGKSVEASFSVHPLPAVGGLLPGLVIEPHIPADFPLNLRLADWVSLRLRAGSKAPPVYGISVRPGKVSVAYPLAPGTVSPSGGIGIGFDFKPGAPSVLFGDPSASRLEFSSASVDLSADFSNGAWTVLVAADLKGFKFVFDPGEGDSLLRFLIGGGKTEIGLPLGLRWGQEGIRLGGSGSFDLVLHPHLPIGPATIDDIDFRLGVPSDPKPRVQLEVGLGISGTLGPLSFALKGVGLRADMVFEPGNLGPLDLALGFKPPNGVGLSLDAGGFSGGGFLRLDPAKGEYEGMLELTFAGFVSVRAVGILSTRLPDGREGFSLLIIIVSEFPPIQLSWGFTLVGVGGLLGLNRTVLLEQLQVGVRDGSLNSILFPTDVVANSSRIIGDLKRVFPAQDGRFLIGPMAKLGWGTPTLITLSLGLILEIPRPMFAIVGVLHMALPADEVAVLHLQVSFAGSVDFERGQLQFDASLFDSRMLTFTLCGDMAVRIFWGDHPNFLLSVGGFHPSYTPPPMNLGEMARLGVVIFQGNPHISAQAYFALTSNSVQFGARVEAYYGIDLFNVCGFLGLDVLIHFDPFHFVAEIEAGLAVRSGTTVLFAIQIQLVLDGPDPWHARGTGSFRIGFIVKVRIDVGFDVTVGDSRQTPLPPVDVLAAMAAALGNLGNWRPRLPAGSNQHVTLRELPDPAFALVLHPFGTLEIEQKLVPLHVAIQRFGSRRPAAGSIFTLADVKVGADAAVVSTTREQFAPAQFFEMSDAEKLSRPSFADYDAGIVVGGDLAPRSDLLRTRDVVYEVIYLPEHHPVRLRFSMAVGLAGAMARGSAVSQSAVSRARRAVSVLEERVALGAEQYAVVSTDDLTLHASHLVFDSMTAADQAVQRLVGERPELLGAVQVLPATAMAAATA